jgi:chromosome segregation and condensation protein ScpB
MSGELRLAALVDHYALEPDAAGPVCLRAAPLVTTEAFLCYLGLSSLAELPALAAVGARDA